jgi:hypothetical protein
MALGITAADRIVVDEFIIQAPRQGSGLPLPSAMD